MYDALIILYIAVHNLLIDFFPFFTPIVLYLIMLYSLERSLVSYQFAKFKSKISSCKYKINWFVIFFVLVYVISGDGL